jgi:hypothetical protein
MSSPARDLIHVPTILAKHFDISMSEARRALAQGGVKVNGETTTDLDVEGPVIRLELGKRRIWRADGFSDPEWLTATHARAQAKMLASLLGAYRSDLPAHQRDELMKSAVRRARAIVDLLERGDGKDPA